MLREILPNIAGPMLADLGLRFVYVVLLLASLSFLGLGVQPPEADWGSLVRENIGALADGGAVGDRAGARHREPDDRRQPGHRQPAGPRGPRTRSTLMGASVVVDRSSASAPAAPRWSTR